jgi:aminoglycoside 3-N-acetyltransferase I
VIAKDVNMRAAYTIHHLTRKDVPTLRCMNALFGKAFDDPKTYTESPPRDAYLEGLLTKESVIALAALDGDEIVGGLLAYQLDKIEQERCEIYIYDLAVAEAHRRRGVATALITRLREIAAERGAWVIYVQADYVDPPAIALYEKLGTREEVLHFDIAVLNERLDSPE